MTSKRVALAALMAFIATNVWVGGPLLALWIGSRLQEQADSSLTIRPTTALAVFASLAVITLVLVRLLGVVSAAYDRVAGIERSATRRRASYLGGDQHHLYPGETPSWSALERIMVVSVAIAAIAFEIWFFFFSASPIDQRSGRGALPVVQRSDDGRLAHHPKPLQRPAGERERRL